MPKKAKIEKIISIRAFAKMMECSEGTVRAAIGEGRIVDAVIKDKNGRNKGIDHAAAQIEWARNYSQGNNISSPVAEKLLGVPPESSRESGDEKIGEITESKKKHEHYKAELSRLELEEKEGTLVQVDQVENQLFAYATEVRIAVQNIPDVCLDEIMSIDDRNEAYQVLMKAINGALNKLTEVVERDFTK